MPAIPLLLCGCIFAMARNVESSRCPTITRSHRSTPYPVESNGSNYTLYQEFVTEGNVHNLNIMWSRIPYSLEYSNGSYRLDDDVINNTTLNASLTLWNIQFFPDYGNYTVEASNNCTSNKTHFFLDIDVCEPDKLPQPITQRNVTVIAEPALPNPLNLVVKFNGTSEAIFALTYWSFGHQACLESGSQHFKFSCNRTVTGQCSFVANLWIPDATYVNAGLYTVQALRDAEHTNASTVDLRIIRQPGIESCTTGPLKIGHNGHTEFVCHISNYSKYAEVIVVENDRTLFNKSTKQLSFGCQPNVPDSSTATCTVTVSTSLHSGQLHYKLCVGYNSSVPHDILPQCSEDITIDITRSSDQWSLKVGLIAGVTVLALLVLPPVLLGVAFRVCRKRKSVQMELHDNFSRPLLNKENGCGYGSNKETRPNTKDDVVERDHRRTGFKTNSACHQGGTVPHRIWKTVRCGPLEREELVHIAKAIPRWSVLARYLGLSEPNIVAIEENHVHDYEEQKIQMLLKWFQQQSTPPTRQSLVRIIEEKMEDPVLAQDITNIVGTQLAECA